MYKTIMLCVIPGCKCEHKDGVIVYEGNDEKEAENALKNNPYTGIEQYMGVIDRIEESEIGY